MISQDKYTTLILNLCQIPIRMRDLDNKILNIDYEHFKNYGCTFSTETSYRKSLVGNAFFPRWSAHFLHDLVNKQIVSRYEYVVYQSNIPKEELDFNLDNIKIPNFDFYNNNKWGKFEFGETYSMEEIFEVYK